MSQTEKALSEDVLPEGLIAFARGQASDAGQLAMQWFRQPLSIDLKSDASPVTEADRAVESQLRQRLAEHYPEHGVLGEEFESVRLDAEYLWVVDPIDGTRSFITGWPIWGTLLALLHRQRPFLGIIEMPALQENWIGIKGQGTFFSDRFRQDQPCHVSTCRDMSAARFYTTSLYYFSEADRRAVEAVIEQVAVPRFGGDCYGYGLLASGLIDLVIEAQLQPFDFLSLIPIIEEAGGIITDWQGNALTAASDGRVIAAATPALHQQAILTLNQYTS